MYDFESTFLKNVDVKISFKPVLVYTVTAKVGNKDFQNNGAFKAKFSRLYGKYSAFISFHYALENISSLFNNMEDKFELSNPKSLYLFYSEENINSQQFLYLNENDFGLPENIYWEN